MATSSLSPTEAARWTRIGALAALAMLLGYLESFIPIPIPGVKLGLANIAVLLALASHDVGGACWVALMKVVATGLLFGNPVTLAYSCAGTLLALALMAPLSQLPTMHIEMVSIVGALAHEAGQLLVAQAMLGTPLVWYSAPLLAIAACITGLLCGIVAGRVARRMEALPAATGKTSQSQQGPASTQESPQSPTPLIQPHASKHASPLPDSIALVGYLALVIASMHAITAPALGTCLALTALLCAFAHTRPRTLWRALAPMLPIALITVAAQIASAQQGTVLLQLGPVSLTKEALVASAIMICRLACVTLSSVALVGIVGREGLARCAQLALRPLQALGFAIEGPELAFSTTLQLLPALADTLGEQLRPRDLWTRTFWNERLPQLVLELYQEVSQL